ncbi:MAG: AsmA family protein, partial [Betaproteobacteria bacterium]|nr:AsmA family protein [Betaproteobacteria bacterium]
MSRTARYLAVCIALIGLVVISAVIVLVTVEFTLPLNAYRDRIAAAAGQAARAEVRISGPVRLFTGLHAGVELNGLQATGKAGRFQWEAQLEQVRVRLSLIELLSGGIRIVDTLASGAVICSIMAPASENAPQAKVQPSAQTSASMRVSGIDRIRFERIAFVIDDACNRDHARVEIEALDASVPAHGQASVMARGIFKGEVWKLALDGP